MDSGQIEQLRDPSVFPDDSSGAEVEILQTHLSVVCLVGHSAYKFKKAIRLPFADFSTLERRRHFCEVELGLNRRLCPRWYRSVEPLRRDGKGRLRLGVEARGEIVDYAVKMRRLPSGRMLDLLLEENTVSRGDVEAIAARVTAFHRTADRGPEVMRMGESGKLREFALNNFSETRDAVREGVFHGPLHRALEEHARDDFLRHRWRLEEREAEGHIVDGHGDLHARNICLTEPVAIYDCLEFSPELRCGDTANEHAFLLMDLRFRGHPELARAYLDAVLLETGDEGMAGIMPMLIGYRAMVRAKVAAIAGQESEIADRERVESVDTARRYLRLAGAVAVEEEGPWWIMLCGLPGSGKSFLAQLLHDASGRSWPVFSSDLIRKELAGVSPDEHLRDEFYSRRFSEKTYDEIRKRAAAANATAPVAILDANFRDREQRERTRERAGEAGARLAVLHLDTPEAIVESRLAGRDRGEASESDAGLEVFRKLRKTFEVPRAGEADVSMDLPGIPSDATLVDQVLTRLLTG